MAILHTSRGTRPSGRTCAGPATLSVDTELAPRVIPGPASRRQQVRAMGAPTDPEQGTVLVPQAILRTRLSAEPTR